MSDEVLFNSLRQKLKRPSENFFRKDVERQTEAPAKADYSYARQNL